VIPLGEVMGKVVDVKLKKVLEVRIGEVMLRQLRKVLKFSPRNLLEAQLWKAVSAQLRRVLRKS